MRDTPSTFTLSHPVAPVTGPGGARQVSTLQGYDKAHPDPQALIDSVAAASIRRVLLVRHHRPAPFRNHSARPEKGAVLAPMVRAIPKGPVKARELGARQVSGLC
jgi:hypothetical protein